MKFEEQFLQKIKTKKKLAMLFFILGILALVFQKSKKQDPVEIPHSSAPESVDTYIPKGFVLIPLDLINVESLNSFIGDKGVVDLYTTKEGRKNKKIAEKIKIIRAPLNPDVYAALVPEGRSRELVLDGEPYYAIVQNKNSTQGQIYKAVTASPVYKIYSSPEVRN